MSTISPVDIAPKLIASADEYDSWAIRASLASVTSGDAPVAHRDNRHL